MYSSFKNFAGDFLTLFLFIIHTQRAWRLSVSLCNMESRLGRPQSLIVTVLRTSISQIRNTPRNYCQHLNWLALHTKLIFSLVLHVQITDKLSYLNRLLWKSRDSSLWRKLVMRQKLYSARNMSNLHRMVVSCMYIWDYTVSKFFAMARDSCLIFCGQWHSLVREVSVCLLGKYTNIWSAPLRNVTFTRRVSKAGTVIPRPLQFLCKDYGSRE